MLTKHLLQSKEVSAVVSQYKNKVVGEDLQHRFIPNVIGITDIVPMLAAALDPRYLHLSFLTVRQHSIAIAVLKEKCKEIFQKKADAHTGEENNELSDQTDHEQPSKKKRQHFDFY